MMKKLLIVLFVLVFAAVSSFADFRQDEKPVTMIHADTAYTLSQNEWTIDLIGPVSYGIIDSLQVGTNFWIWFAQIPNVFVKWNIISEDEMLPALSLGGLFGSLTLTGTNNLDQEAKLTTMLYNFAFYASKRLSEQFYVNASYSYNGLGIVYEGPEGTINLVNDINNALGTTDSLAMSIVSLGGIYELSGAARLMIEGIAYFYQVSSRFAVSPGFEWALGDTFRLKLAVTVNNFDSSKVAYVPYLNLKWRLK